MYNPNVYEMDKTQEMISSFGGYNCNPVIPDNCFSDEMNMSGGEFPLLAPRNKRAYFNVQGDRLHGLLGKSKLIYINNGTLYYGGEPISDFYFGYNPERQFVSMGARLLIFPDKIYVNTADLEDCGYLDALFVTYEDEEELVTCSLAKGDGDLYKDYVVSSAEPEEMKNGDLWLDTSVTPNELKQYFESLGMWMPLAETYVRISCTGIGKNFKVGDGVTLRGFEYDDLNGSHIIRDKGDDFITVTGIIPNTIKQTKQIAVERKIPYMDFVVESGNRIWGCNSKKNEIYASKLGDPTNFECFQGISTDSYAVTVGTDGEFTGAVSFRGYIIFFKEHCIHKIYGQNPPYTVNTSYIRGVQKGSHKSLCVVNEALYYKSPNGICVFEGGVPVDISEALGGVYYTDAVAGSLGNRYYICMSDKNGGRVLFNYDEARNIWHKEDDIDVREFANHNGNLYFIGVFDGVERLCLADGENVYGNFSGELSGWFLEENFCWSCETGLWGLSIPENKYYSGLVFRVWAEPKAMVKVELQTNSDGVWKHQITVRPDKVGSFTLPFAIERCDHLKIRISGKGRVKILGISRKTELGSELNVRP